MPANASLKDAEAFVCGLLEPTVMPVFHASEAAQDLYFDETYQPSVLTRRGHESSRNLLNLLRLAHGAGLTPVDADEDLVDGIINRHVLRSLLSALHHRDPATMFHSRRVAVLATGLAEYLGWEGRMLKLLEVAALLHDIGKVGVPDHILFKPARLNPDELELIALHYNIGLDVLQACRVDRAVLEIVGQAQARYSGGDSLKILGRETHLGARILAIADAYESMNTPRADRPARPHAEIMEALSRGSGTFFDSNVVAALGRYVDTHGLPYDADSLNAESSSASDADNAEAHALCHVFAHLYLLESLYDGFALYDGELKAVVWNRSLQNLVGQPTSSVLGHRWSSERLGYADAEGNRLSDDDCPMNQVIRGEGAVVREVQLTRRDGRALIVELQCLPVIDEYGQMQGAVEIFRDLTRSGSRRPQEFRDLKLAATRDALTSVANRGELETQLTLLLNEYTRNLEAPFSVIFADADHFKSINDTYGHTVGDQVLIELAKCLQGETYCGEMVARYGGEEFVVLCPDTTLDQAERRSERLRTAIRNARMGGNNRLRVTASFGVTEVEPGDSVESVLRRADKALYNAKHAGRDRTCCLTNRELLATETPPDDELGDDRQLQSTTWFSAVVAADMVIYKLGGYVEDYGAKLIEVTSDHVLLRHGRLGWFGYWGKTADRQPVEIEVLFSSPLGGRNNRARSSTKIDIGLKIRPIGRVRDREVFNLRVKRLIREIKHYFAAD